MAKKKVTPEDLIKAKSPDEFKKLLHEQGGVELDDSYDDDDSEENSILINPSTTKRPKMEPVEASFEPDIGQKSKMIGGKCAIELESSGRFSVPGLVYFGDYDVDDINNVALSREEDVLNNIVVALNKQKAGDDWDVEDMVLEEFYETLISIKYRFLSKMHNHRWLCECQSKYPENMRKMSEQEIDLSTIRYISIEESEEKLRENYAEVLSKLSDEDFEKLQIRKYGKFELSREQEVARMTIKEPVVVVDYDKTYIFRLVRVKDMLQAMSMAQKKFNWKIRQRRNEPVPQNSENLDEIIARKDEEILKLEHEKAKFMIKVMKALTLLSFNENEIKSLDDKLEIFGQMSKTAMFKFSRLLEAAKFGIHDEREFTCNFCQKTEKRLLQRAISPIELFPVDDSNKSGSGRITQFDPGIDIYFMP